MLKLTIDIQKEMGDTKKNMNKLRDMFDESKVNEVYQSWIDLANKEHDCSVCKHYICTFFCNGSEKYECELTGEHFPDNRGCASWVAKTVVFGTGEDLL